MNIVIDPFDKKSIAAAEKLVRQYKKDFEVKEAEFTRRLAEIGVQLASGIYATADYDGEKIVSVSMQKIPNGYAVVASGDTVGFLEFGTGVRNREWAGSELGYTPPPHGSYGKGHGKQPYGWWFYPNEGVAAQHTYGNPPAEAMLTARNQMIERVTAIAREVWR